MKKYVLRDAIPKEIDERLKEYHPLVRELLNGRGITATDEAEKFLNPDYDKYL